MKGQLFDIEFACYSSCSSEINRIWHHLPCNQNLFNGFSNETIVLVQGRRSRGEILIKLLIRDNLIQLTSLPSTLNTNCQIDISFPSIFNSASNITIRNNRRILKKSRSYLFKTYFNSNTNENFHRWTLQVEENNGK